ncbi:hypothetical protein OAP26_00990 [Flavobacteriaceae bacterium]|nr:hypothetical protein [Flavobacteriaceae bacterium]
MKSTVFFFFIILCNLSYSQSSFSDGYKDGYKKGYCLEDIGCVQPIPPIPPISAAGFSTYSDGYARGIQAGQSKRQSDRSKRESTLPSLQSMQLSTRSTLPSLQSMQLPTRSTTATNYIGSYENPSVTATHPESQYIKAQQKLNQSMGDMIGNLAASGAFKTARQKAEDIISLNSKNLNRYKYIVISNIRASKDNEIPKMRDVIVDDLSETNFKIISDLDDVPEDLRTKQNLALYLYLISENENWPFKNVLLTLFDVNGEIIHQRAVRHDRTAKFLTGLVLQTIKNHPHRFDENLSNELNISSESTNNSKNRDQAIKELKELKELFDLDLISKEEFEENSKELKEIILGN